MKRIRRFGLALAITVSLIFSIAAVKEQQSADPSGEPHYTSGNRMLRPANYREWVWLSSGLGMSYTPGPADQNPDFDNVFV